MVFGDFDADGLTGLAQLVIALRRLGIDADTVRSRRGSRRGTACRSRPWTAAAAAGITLIITVDTGSTSVAEIAGGRRLAGSTSSSPTTTTCRPVLPAAVAIVNPHREDSDLPGPRSSRAAGSRSPWPGCCSVSSTAAEADALDLAELATIGTVSDVVPDPGGEPGDRAPRPGADAHGAPTRDRRAAGARRVAPVVGGPRDRRLRHRPAPQRGRPGGGGARRGPPPARRDARGGGGARRHARGGEHHPARPDADRDRRGARRPRPAAIPAPCPARARSRSRRARSAGPDRRRRRRR